MSKVRVIHEKCDPELANDKRLPYTAYLVQYEDDGKIYHDISIANKQADLFDHYWDLFKKGFKSMVQTEGHVNPKLWDPNPKQPKAEKKKRRRDE